MLAERGARLKRARKALEEEQAAYVADSQNVGKLVEMKMNRLTSDGAEFDRGFAPDSQPATDSSPEK